MATEIRTDPKAPRPRPPIGGPPSELRRAASGWERFATWCKRGILLVGTVGALAVGSSYMIGDLSPRESSSILTYTITRGDLLVTVTEEGSLESSNNTEIKCQVEGGSTILTIVDDGAIVEPGDVLIQLDTSAIEDEISRVKIVCENSRTAVVQSESNLAVARISLSEYQEGLYPSLLKRSQKDVTFADATVHARQDELNYSKKRLSKGYINALQFERDVLNLEHAQIELDIARTNLIVLERFSKAKRLEELQAVIKTSTARLASTGETLKLDESRLARAEAKLENCEIKAETGGLVIFPVAPSWKPQPDIEVGARVHQRQLLLMMPDLSQMQVKIGVHEAKVDRLKPGLPARVKIQGANHRGELDSVATVTDPVGWWNGNIVKYDTIVKVDTDGDLKPGMSAEVELFLARHEDVLTIPVAAVLEQDEEFFCWVQTDDGTEKRALKLGDSDEQFIVVEDGLEEGDRVALNPLVFLDDAQRTALRPATKDESQELPDPSEKSQSKETSSKSPKTEKVESKKQQSPKPGAKKPDR